MLMQPDQPLQTPPSPQSQISSEHVILSPQPISASPLSTGVPKKSSPMLKVLGVLVILGLLGGLGYFGYQRYVSSQQIADLTTPPVIPPTPHPDPTANWTERKFEKLKLTFQAPSDLTMEESELTPGQITGHIQNDKIGEEFFQMYFMYQKTGKQVKQSDIQTLKNDSKFIIPGTERDIAVDGYSGFAGQVADKSKRFVTALVKDGYLLIVYTAEPTQANKELSDRIISTFKFTD